MKIEAVEKSTWMECLKNEKWWIPGGNLFKEATFQCQFLVRILQ